jgi:uncharacterized protein DUF4349
MRRTALIVISVVVVGVLVLAVLGTAASHRLLAPRAEAGLPQYGLGGGGAAPQESFAQPAPYAPGYDAAKTLSESPSDVVANNSPVRSDRLVIQNADLSIVVKDVGARVQSIQDMAKQMGGFVVSVNVYQTYASNGVQVPQAQVVVRVPQEKLDEALAQIKKDTVDVQNETRSGQDVTDQYVDLQSRLTAKEAAEAQLLKIMQNAEKTEDVLAVYQQLQQVESDIEVLKGQIKYTEQSAALSAVSVNIVAEETVKPLEVGGWKPQGVARDAIQSLIFFWQDFVNFLIRFFLYTLPVLITIGLPLFLIFLLGRWIYRKVRKPAAETIVPAPKTRK